MAEHRERHLHHVVARPGAVEQRTEQQPTSPGSDADVNLQGFISVTPMRADLTAHDALEALKAIE
jgi:broad specificity polyphosphatase/5'/3'-nucleotidase SurE